MSSAQERLNQTKRLWTLCLCSLVHLLRAQLWQLHIELG